MEFHSKECLICHKLFFKLSSDSSKYWERKKYCSQDCYGKSLLGRKISLLIKEKMSDTHIRIGSRPPSNGSHRSLEEQKKWKQDWNIKNKDRLKLYRKRGKVLRKSRLLNAGDLSIETIQIIYEENIKKYGTLTCYLCLLPIPFGKDHLEHKIPLSRGGTNARENLDIACQHCNNKKFTKTESEYRKELSYA